jgi:hypothetical protein
MSVLELFSWIESHPMALVVYTAGLPVLALLFRLVHGPFKAALAPWKYGYTFVVYLSCIPGIFVLFAAVYQFTFSGVDLLALDLLVYALPVLSMIVTLLLVRRTIRFDDIPGFRRIAGLVAVTAATFVILLVLDRLRIFLFFRAPFAAFLALGAAIFIALRLGGRMLFRR